MRMRPHWRAAARRSAQLAMRWTCRSPLPACHSHGAARRGAWHGTAHRTTFESKAEPSQTRPNQAKSRIKPRQAKPSHYSQQTPIRLGTECPAIAPPRFGLAQRCACSDAPGRSAQRPRSFPSHKPGGAGWGCACDFTLPAAPDFTRYAPGALTATPLGL